MRVALKIGRIKNDELGPGGHISHKSDSLSLAHITTHIKGAGQRK